MGVNAISTVGPANNYYVHMHTHTHARTQEYVNVVEKNTKTIKLLASYKVISFLFSFRTFTESVCLGFFSSIMWA